MTRFKVVLLSSVTWQWGYFASPLESSSRDRELKFPLRANRNLTLPITPLSPRGSTLGRALEEIASDVIYFTVLFLSFSFLPPSLLPYLFMMFAVIGSGLSGHVAEILISSLPSSPPPPPLQSPLLLPCVTSEAQGLTHDQPTSLAAHPASFFHSFPFFVLLSPDFFSPWDSALTSCWGFAVFESTLCYGIAESRSWGCGGVGGGGFSPPSLHCILPYIHQSSTGPCSGTWLAVDLSHWRLIPPDNTQITVNFCY